MPNKKKNAYTFYVEERCRGTGRHYSQSFPFYAKDWDRMTVAEKEKYFQMAAADRHDGLIPLINKSTDEVNPQLPPRPINRFMARPLEQRTSSLSRNPSGPRPTFGGGGGAVMNFSAESVAESISHLKMVDIIMDVDHDVGEFVETTPEGEVADVETPSLDELKVMGEEFTQLMTLEYPEIKVILFDLVLVMSCIPVAPMDSTMAPINRPLELAVKGFKIGAGHLKESLFHAFIDPGNLSCGRQYAVLEARRKYHQIPAASYMKTGESCAHFHANYKLDADYYTVYLRLLKTAGYGRSKMIPILTADDVGMTWACLTWLRESANQQAEKEGLPGLPPVNLSTVSDFMANILRQMNLETMDRLESVHNTYSQRRYHHQFNLRCPFHREVDSELCASATASDKIYSTFDIFRSLKFALPESDKFVPPPTVHEDNKQNLGRSEFDRY